MLRVPAPEEIRPHLEQAWDDGESLVEFNKPRRAQIAAEAAKSPPDDA